VPIEGKEMICPHCGKPLEKKIDDKIKKQAIALYKQGYSMRDIERKLEFRISFSSVSRLVKGLK
jgi:transposase-like protein